MKKLARRFTIAVVCASLLTGCVYAKYTTIVYGE